MYYVVIKGKYAVSKIPYATYNEAVEGENRAKRKIAFIHCDIEVVYEH